MNSFHYVYILESKLHPGEIYTGMTENLKRRLSEHNAGKVFHTSKFKPWKIRSATAFPDRPRAAAFEHYLKSGSGRAFLNRHL
ncbi:MAG TPA: GIY-YIG nuclease family protein [Verrucomicrobiae bacterium]|nr:GIY-YIG nuclease family protein [Verrucomicrobiae bacterium]